MRNKQGLDFSSEDYYDQTLDWDPANEAELYKKHPVPVANYVLVKSVLRFMMKKEDLQSKAIWASSTSKQDFLLQLLAFAQSWVLGFRTELCKYACMKLGTRFQSLGWLNRFAQIPIRGKIDNTKHSVRYWKRRVAQISGFLEEGDMLYGSCSEPEGSKLANLFDCHDNPYDHMDVEEITGSDPHMDIEEVTGSDPLVASKENLMGQSDELKIPLLSS